MKLRIISLILAFCIAVPMCAFAEIEKDDSGLKEAISAAKSKLEIPDVYTDFYSQIEQDNNSKVFYLSWSGEGNSKQNGGNASAKVDGLGRIIYYSHYEYGSFEGDYKLSKFDYNSAVDAAKEYINKICPEFSQSMVAERKSNYIERNYNSYNIKFSRYENGIPYYNNYINVSISARNKKLTQLEVKWEDIVKFPSNQGTFPFDKAKENFKKKIGVSLGYYNDNNGNVILQYYPNMLGQGYINAFTGEISKTNMPSGENLAVRDLFQYDLRSYADDEQNNLLSVEHLEQSARSQLGIDDLYALGPAYLMKNDMGENIYHLVFASTKKLTINVEINALTKEITGYFKNDEDSSYDIFVGFDKALNTAKDFALKVSPEKFKACGQNIRSSKDFNYYFLFPRMVNGIEYANNGIMISISSSTGNVISYSLGWDRKVFPSASDAVSSDEVYKELFDRVGMELQYVATAKSSLIYPKNAKDIDIKLVYNFKPGKPLNVNTKSGKLSDINGNAFTGDYESKYADTQGHRAQKYIDTLYACNILDGGEYFRPDDNITQYDYLSWIYRAVMQYYANDAAELYNSLIYGYNVITVSEVDNNAEISYEQAVKYLIRLLGYTDVAELKDTYQTGFVDEGTIEPELIGYAAIAKGLKIINGNAFTPKNKVTRATAAEIIYNLLQS